MEEVIGILTDKKENDVTIGVEEDFECGLMCPSCARENLRFDAMFCDKCGKALPHTQHKQSIRQSLVSSISKSNIMSAQSQDLSFSKHLWNKIPQVQKKIRDSKHTARYAAQYYDMLAECFIKCGKMLIKLSKNDSYDGTFAHEGPTLLQAWIGTRTQTQDIGDAFVTFGTRLKKETSEELTKLRKHLSKIRTDIMERINVAAKNYEKASLNYENISKQQGTLRQKFQRVCELMEVAKQNKDTPRLQQLESQCNRLQMELDSGNDEEMMCQAMKFSNQNQYNQIVSKSLEEYQDCELQRIGEMKRILSNSIMIQNQTWSMIGESVGKLLTIVMDINASLDTTMFINKEKTKETCPWIQTKPSTTAHTTNNHDDGALKPPPPIRKRTSSQSLDTESNISNKNNNNNKDRAKTPIPVSPKSETAFDRKKSIISNDDSKHIESKSATTAPPPPLRTSLSLLEFAKMHKDDMDNLSTDDWNNCAIERLLMCLNIGLLSDNAYHLIKDVMRVSQGMTSNNFTSLKETIDWCIDEYHNCKSSDDKKAILSLDFPLYILTNVTDKDFDSRGWTHYKQFQTRMLNLLALNLLLSENQSSKQIRDLLSCKQYDKILKLILNEYKNQENLNKQYFHSKIMHELYTICVKCAYRPEEEDDLLSEDEDDEDVLELEPARLHREWKSISVLLNNIREYFPPVSYEFHQLTILSVINDVVVSRGRMDNFTVFDTMADDKMLLNALIDLTNDLNFKFTENDKEALVLLQSLRSQYSEWLGYFHCAEPHTVGPLMKVLYILVNDSANAGKYIKRLVELSTVQHYESIKARQLENNLMMMQWSSGIWENFGKDLSKAILDNSQFKMKMIVHQSLTATEWSLIRLLHTYMNDLISCAHELRVSSKIFDIQKSMVATRIVWNQLLNVFKHISSSSTCEHICQQLKAIQENYDTGLQFLNTKKRKQLSNLVIRCVSVDTWLPVNDNLLYSSSVLDMWGIISRITNIAWPYFSKMAFCSDGKIMVKWLNMIADSIKEYSDALINTTGQISDCRPQYIQHQRKKSKRSKVELLPIGNLKLSQNPTMSKLAQQNIHSLCIRIENCAYAADQLNIYIEDLETKWNGLADTIDKERKTNLQEKYDEIEAILPKIGNLDTSYALNICKELQGTTHRLMELTAVKAICGNLREELLLNLYYPQATTENRIHNTVLEQTIDDTMADLFKHVKENHFASLVEYIYKELMYAFKWILLYGDRTFQLNDIPILKQDLLILKQMFTSELGDNADLLSQECFDIIIALGTSSESLVSSLLPNETIVKLVLKKRDDKIAKKFCKKHK